MLRGIPNVAKKGKWLVREREREKERGASNSLSYGSNMGVYGEAIVNNRIRGVTQYHHQQGARYAKTNHQLCNCKLIQYIYME